MGATSGGSRFRLLAVAVPAGTLILGVPLHETDVTLNQLKWIELLVACAVIATALLLGVWLITASLRPLVRMEETAAAIGAGDLSRRVEPDGGNTEIGRLGASLNAMLGQIEDAFAERSASEARLRRFISDASHELRTPIAAVSAYAELFDRGARDRPDDLERAMAGIQRESRRIGVLVADLLLLARLDQGRPLESRPADLSAIAGEAVDAAHAMEPARPLALEAAAPVTVTGDPERLRQVIDNLLANVRAHTPADCRRHGARAPRGRERDRSRSRTPGPAWTPSRPRTSSSASTAATPRARATTAARVSGWRSSPRSSRRTAAPSRIESRPGAGTTIRVTLPDPPPGGHPHAGAGGGSPSGVGARVRVVGPARDRALRAARVVRHGRQPGRDPAGEAADHVRGTGEAELLQRVRREARLEALTAEHDRKPVALGQARVARALRIGEAPLEHVAGHDPRAGDLAFARALRVVSDVHQARARPQGLLGLGRRQPLQPAARLGQQLRRGAGRAQPKNASASA